jgi:hypothetical protein
MKIHTVIYTLLLVLVCGNPVSADAGPGAVIDTLHQAGTAGDPSTFLELLAPGAVLLVPVGSERVEGESLQSFVAVHLSHSGAWGYRSNQRNIKLSPDGAVAWFNESLLHDQLGPGWGSGVLIKTGGAWKIAQYHLTLTEPDEFATKNAVAEQATTASDLSDTTESSNNTTMTEESATEVATKPEKKTYCRKIRHKTNRRASC